MSDKTIIIPLSKTGKHQGKYETIIDIEDSDLAGYNWQVMNVTSKGTIYVSRKTKSKGKQTTHYIHRIILERKLGRELEKTEHIDHIDGNGLNNRRENLRLATRFQNMQNRGKASSNTSGYKGAFYRKDRGYWYSQIIVHGKKIYLGSFNTAKDAHEAYCKAAKELHGDFYNNGE